MKASPILIAWHNENTPIYSTHFEPHGKGRLATAGGDNNVRLWRVDRDGEERTVTYLTTLIKVGIIRTDWLMQLADHIGSIHKQSMSSVSPREVRYSVSSPESNRS